MSNKITVTTTPKNRISINTQQKGIVKKVSVGQGKSAGKNRLVELVDVDAAQLENNNTLVYDTSSEKFIVKELPIVDGGNF